MANIKVEWQILRKNGEYLGRMVNIKVEWEIFR